MRRFRVTAINAEGLESSFEREAAGADVLTAELAQDGWQVLTLDDTVGGNRAHHGGSRALSAEEARQFAEQVAALSKAGAPMADGLRALQAELPVRGTLRAVVADVADRLERGEALDQAVEAQGGRFPRHLRDLLLAGARSGRLEAVLGEFVSYSQVGTSLRHALWLSLAYPVVLLIAFGGIFLFLCLVVVQGFKSIFADFGVNLPAITVSLIRVSDAVVAAGWGIVVVPTVGFVLFLIANRFLLDAASRSRMLSYIPLIGSLAQWTALAEFSHYLGLLVECAIPLPKALPLAAEGTGHGALQEDCAYSAQQIEAGEPMGLALSHGGIFPRGVGKMLAWAEDQPALSATLHMLGEMFEARARAQASFIGSVSVVFAVVMVIWGVAYVVTALYVPMIQLISKLSG
jgi:type II secretory pathway component PulF